MRRIFFLVLLASICFSLSAGAAPAQKKYYLTKNSVAGGLALESCANGYHMASVYELLDFGSLKYETNLGRTLDDSGFGPPAGQFGWARSGSGSSAFENCVNWTSFHPDTEGLAIKLPTAIESATPATVLSPWITARAQCAPSTLPVWCVQN